MRRRLLTFLTTVLVLGLLAGYCTCRWLLPYRTAPALWTMQGEWISTVDGEGYIGYYRTTVSLDAGVSNAWVTIAARDTFELIVNGKVIGNQSLWKPNRGYQLTMSERGQRVSHAKRVPWVAYARDYQWGTYSNYELPIFFDLTRALRPGRNVICVKVDSRTTPNTLCARGEIVLRSGRRMPLDSDRSWKATDLPPREVLLDWTDTHYNDLDWKNARVVTAPGKTYRTFDPDIFAQPFLGHWLRAGSASQHQPVWFETNWHLDRRPDDAWIRLITNRAYDLYINGRKAEPRSLGASELAAGDWIVHTSHALGPQGGAEALDPDDARSLFRPESEGQNEDAPATGQETVAPTALLRDRQTGTFDAYSVASMLKAGDNTIAVRLVSRDASLKWSPQLALDARVKEGAWVSDLVATSANWTTRVTDGAGRTGRAPAIEAGAVNSAGAGMPTKRYLGNCYSTNDKLREWMFTALPSALLVFGTAALLLWRMSGSEDRRERFLGRATAVMAIMATVLVSAVALDCCFAVRDEILWTLSGKTWLVVLLLSLVAGGLAAALPAGKGDREFRFSPKWRTHGLALALCAVLLLCGFTRLYRLDFQPTDVDEWASLQTILAIADTGTPKLIEDVFYTRSPLFHYLVAGSVALFGKNFWAMRVPSGLFAVGTCALIYLCGARLFKSRWVGLGAAFLFAIHPLAIGMGHQIRFYQQQQFFSLLTIYFFCLGFVTEQRMTQRYWTLAAFFAAVFSQEISVMIACALLPSYLLFAEGKSWRSEVKWAVAAACGMVFVVLDFVVFQTVCLTVVEGVSPSVEPALKLNFMYPSKLYWIFSLYSRLHFGLSAVFFAGLPFALRSRERSVVVLCLTFFAGIIFSTVLITGAGIRFQYWLLPLLLLLAVHGAREIAAFVLVPAAGEGFRRHRVLRWAMAALLVTMIGLSFSPWKIPAAYATKILPDVDGALAYVRQNIGPDDALAISAPHTSAALCEIGRVDYDIEIPMLQDFVFRKNGRLIDRNAGAEVIDKLDDLQDACARHQRVWVVLNRDIRFRSAGQKIAWQDPGGRFELFVRTNFELKHQTYLTDVFLWDSSKGRLRTFRRSL